MKKRSKVYWPLDENFYELVLSSKSYAECMRKLGFATICGHSVQLLKQRIKELDIPIDHFK